MFFALALISMFGYVLQSVLLVGFARKIDAGKLITYRSVSLSITLLPLLFFLREGDLDTVFEQAHIFLIAGAFGVLYLWCSYRAMRFLPAGSNSAFIAASNTISILFWGYAAYGESIPFPMQCIVLLIVLSSFVLGFSQKKFEHLDVRITHGILLAFLAGVPGALTKILLSLLAKDMHPFVAGYFWEVSIGFLAAIFFMSAHYWKTKKILSVNLRTFAAIFFASSPTLIGTGAFALALRMGPLSIVQAIGAGGSLVLTGIISAILYGEHLTRKQWIPILVITVSIVMLKLLS